MDHPREEIEAAFRHHRELNDTQQWDAYADLFTDDGVYVEHEMGTFRGREAIREWIVPCMAPFVNAGWDYPLDWFVIDGNRIILRWLNRLPERRRPGRALRVRRHHRAGVRRRRQVLVPGRRVQHEGVRDGHEGVVRRGRQVLTVETRSLGPERAVSLR